MPTNAAAPLAQLAEQLTLDHLPGGANLEEYADAQSRAALGAAVEHEQGLIDPDLAAIINFWGELPEEVRLGIVAMVRAIATNND